MPFQGGIWYSSDEAAITPKHNDMETPKTPYEQMCDDLVARTITAVKDKIPDADDIAKHMKDACDHLKGQIESNLKDKLDALAYTKLIIEDRRGPSVVTATIDSPVHSSMADVVGILQADCWPALVGPAGSGKTRGVMQLATAILKIAPELVCVKQMHRMIAPHELIGYCNADGKYVKGAWTDAILGYVYDDNNGNRKPTEMKFASSMIVADEMDNANENIIMLLKAIATGVIMMPYGIQPINPGVRVIATMNTWGNGATREYVGRCAQDAALLNEFQFQVWDYDTQFEWALLQQQFASYKDTGKWKIEHMRTLLDMFIAMRKKAEQQKVRVIIATRNVLAVARMLLCNPTWSVDKALWKSVYKGLKPDEVRRVEAPECWTKHKDISNVPRKDDRPHDAEILASDDVCPI